MSWERIIGVYVERNQPGMQYTCMASDLGWCCGMCGEPTLGTQPIVGDTCHECGSIVRFVRREPYSELERALAKEPERSIINDALQRIGSPDNQSSEPTK